MSGAISAAAAVYTIYAGERADKKADTARKEQKEQNAVIEKKAEQNMNAANQKKPDVGALLAASQQRNAGSSSTMLTGSAGVDPNTLVLGKNTLLGT